MTFKFDILITIPYETRTSDRLKDTHKAPSNKTTALTKSMNIDIWVVGTSYNIRSSK